MESNRVEILLVENNSDEEELAMLALKNNNIADVHVARSDSEVLKYLFGSAKGDGFFINHRPKLILLNLKSSNIDWLNVLKKIKKHPWTKKIPIVILTASCSKIDMLDSYSLGVDDYICRREDINKFIETDELGSID